MTAHFKSRKAFGFPAIYDEHEIRSIAKFIVSVSTDIPDSLLAFHPHFYMSDMPLTTRALAYRCLSITHGEGLKNVRIGNIHLLV
jgi:pyruvate formate lyase activating enzyme